MKNSLLFDRRSRASIIASDKVQPLRYEGKDMDRWTLAALFLIAVSADPAESQPLLDDAKAFNPYSETAIAITGPHSF